MKFAIGGFILIAFALGFITGSRFEDRRHVIHPEYVELWKYERDNLRVDLITCEAQKVEAIINERMRLTGRPNP